MAKFIVVAYNTKKYGVIMIKFFLIGLVVLGLYWVYWNTSYSSYANKPIQNRSSGIVSYGKETIEALHANGFVSLDGTTVLGKLEVNGSLKIIDASIGFLECSGYTSMQDSTVHEATVLAGFLNATRVVFDGPITTTTQKMSCRDCSMESILVKSTVWSVGSQSIELTGNTVVKGSITFEAGNGKVYLSNRARILGKVIGGEVENIS